jgi:hypothetical protein
MTTPLTDFYDDPDWQQAFETVDYSGYNVLNINDVTLIIVADPGKRGGEAWLGVFQMKGGKYITMRAVADIIGWDQAMGAYSLVEWFSNLSDALARLADLPREAWGAEKEVRMERIRKHLKDTFNVTW